MQHTTTKVRALAGTSSPSDSSPPGEAEQDSTSIHEGGSEVQTQKAEPSPAALRKRNQKLKEQCRSLQDELALLKVENLLTWCKGSVVGPRIPRDSTVCLGAACILDVLMRRPGLA